MEFDSKDNNFLNNVINWKKFYFNLIQIYHIHTDRFEFNEEIINYTVLTKSSLNKPRNFILLSSMEI